MKRSTLYLLLYIAQIFTLQNCSPKNSQEAKGNISPPITPKAVMTVAEAKAFLKTSEPKREKEITVIARCWGTIESLGGEVLLFIGDKNFDPKEKNNSTNRDDNFFISFKREDADSVRAIPIDEIITVSGRTSYTRIGMLMNNCKIIEQ